MSYQAATPNTVVGDMSPSALSLALNTLGVFIPVLTTEVRDWGFISVAVPKGFLRLIIRAEEEFGDNESLALALQYQDRNGVAVNNALVTLTLADISSSGEFTILNNFPISKIEPGTTVRLDLIHIPGAFANIPDLDIIGQVY